MRLVLATSEFCIHGQSYAGFPLLLDDDMRSTEPVSSFLLDICLRSGRVASRASWKKYGRDLYDFFSFLETNDLDWEPSFGIGYLGPVELYRDWSLTECGLARSTVNHRLRTIRRFYEWCLDNGVLQAPPFSKHTVERVRSTHFKPLPVAAYAGIESRDFMLRELRHPIRFLSLDQCRQCIQALSNPTHRLIFWLMLATGLRNEEVRTFPEAYVFDPRFRHDLHGKAKVRIELKPAEMRTKGVRARSIDVPVTLMSALWWWTVKLRPARARQRADKSTACLLTEAGNAYSESAIERVFSTLSSKVGFNVTPHMLRHSFATYTLYGLRRHNYRGDALLYVRDRLGHASIETTMIYLHLVEQLESDLILEHEAEIDALFGEANGGPEKTL